MRSSVGGAARTAEATQKLPRCTNARFLLPLHHFHRRRDATALKVARDAGASGQLRPCGLVAQQEEPEEYDSDAEFAGDSDGYIDACKKGGRAPFAAAKKIFLEAFASGDPAKGGCPALPGP